MPPVLCRAACDTNDLRIKRSRVDGVSYTNGKTATPYRQSGALAGAARLHGLACAGADVGASVFGIFASIAEFERELIRERVRSGLAAARAWATQRCTALPPQFWCNSGYEGCE